VTRLAARIVQGVSLHTACECEGITQRTLSNWGRWHAEGREPYASLFPVLKRAKAQARATAEKRVFAGELQWQSSARWLESIDPDTWRRTERREVDVSGIEIPWPDLAQPGIEGARAAARRSSRPVPEGRKDAA